MNRGSANRRWKSMRRFTSFNEAPIHESGKCGGLGTLSADVRNASMRPRFMNRGSRKDTTMQNTNTMLQ